MGGHSIEMEANLDAFIAAFVQQVLSHFGQSRPLPVIVRIKGLATSMKVQVAHHFTRLGGKTGYYSTNIDGADRVIQIITMDDGNLMLRLETDPKIVSQYESEHASI